MGKKLFIQKQRKVFATCDIALIFFLSKNSIVYRGKTFSLKKLQNYAKSCENVASDIPWCDILIEVGVIEQNVIKAKRKQNG